MAIMPLKNIRFNMSYIRGDANYMRLVLNEGSKLKVKTRLQ
jgi:hypothetical protein